MNVDKTILDAYASIYSKETQINEAIDYVKSDKALKQFISDYEKTVKENGWDIPKYSVSHKTAEIYFMAAEKIQEILPEYNKLKNQLDAAYSAKDIEKFTSFHNQMENLLLKHNFSFNITRKVRGRKKFKRFKILSPLVKSVDEKIEFIENNKITAGRIAKSKKITEELSEARINNIVDFHNELAKAIEKRDPYAVEKIGRTVGNWMQMPDEERAQQNLINAITEVLYDIEENS